MIRYFFNRVAFLLLVSLGFFPALSVGAQIIHTVNGGTGSRLAEAAGAISSSPGGTHVIEFGGYSDIGSFSLDNPIADTILFRRKSIGVSSLSFSSTPLFSITQFSGVLIFRGLSFKASTKNALLLAGGAPLKENRALIFDSCQIFGDTLTSASFLAWVGAAESKVIFRKSFVTFRTGNGNIKLEADSILIDHCVFNSSMGLIANVQKLLSVKGSTFVRTQLVSAGLPQGSSIAVSRIQNNLFLIPANSRTGPINMIQMGSIAPDSVLNNARDSRYTLWDQGQYNNVYQVGNGNVNTSATFSDSTEAWNWLIAGEMTRGAFSPTGSTNAMPSYTLFPGNSTLKKRVGKDSVSLVLDNAEIPRMVDVTYGSAAYPSDIDSLRTFYLKDTSLTISGPATVASIELPGISTYGSAVLVSVSGSTFISQTRNPTPNMPIFVNSGSANQFIPAWGGQNTKKGTKVTPGSLPAGKSLTFSSVQLSGVTSFFTTKANPPGKRIRLLQKGAQTVSLAESTTVLASGNISYGVGTSLDSGAWNPDSVFFWVQGVGFRKPFNTGTQFVDTLPFRNPLEAVLSERLGIGIGKDTLILGSGDTLFTDGADKGFQIAPTTSAPSESSFPYLANFSKGYSFTWQGREANAGETVKLKIKKAFPKQVGFVASGATLDTMGTALDGDGLVFTLPESGAGKTYFLGQRYSIGAGIGKDMALGQDSIKGLLSSTPGEISTDSMGLTANGLPLASSRFLGGRRIVSDNLSIQGTFAFSFVGRTAFIPDSVHSYVLRGGKWTGVTTARSGSRFAFSLGAGDTEVAVLEGLPIFKSSNPPQVSVSLGSLSVTPNLSVQEKERVQSFKVELISIDMDGTIAKDTSKAYSVDSTALLSLGTDRMYAYRVSYQILSGMESPDTTWIILESRRLSAKVIQSVPQVRNKLAWHLVGLPCTGTYNKNLKAGISTLKDSTQLLLLDKSGTRKDTLAGTDGRNPTLQRGKGYFFYSSETFKPKVDSTDTLNLKSFVMNSDSEGWKVITNPFPFPYPLDQIKISGNPISHAMQLSDSTKAGGGIAYSWLKRDTLKAFEGYALYIFGTSRLTFDPFPFNKSGLPKKAGIPSGTIQITAYNEDGFNRAYLAAGATERNVPYMPVPSSSLMLNVAGNLIQAVQALDEVDQSITLTSVRAGRATFNAGLISGGGLLVSRLFDPRSGKLLDLSKNPEVIVSQGDNSFRLIAGNAEFVAAKTASLSQSLPRELSISQNFPNPWNGATQIRYVLPAGHGQILNGKLEIESLNGRRLFSKDLLELSVGSHALRVTESNWQAGVYVYRLTVGTEQKVLRLQKRMIVAK